MDKKIQAKHLSEHRILDIIDKVGARRVAHEGYGLPWCFMWDLLGEEEVIGKIDYEPIHAPFRVLLAKMQSMERRGLVTGCTCGCRGDFELTDKGRAALDEYRAKNTNAAEARSLSGTMN